MSNPIYDMMKQMETQKDIADAIENALNKRYNAIKKELEKEKNN